jgi:hypothetical protein
LDTAQTAIVVTGAVGALGLISPAILGWVLRDHERKLARAARLHEQRLNVYHGLGQLLEMEPRRSDQAAGAFALQR